MSAADQLRAAKALIDAPEKWTRGTYARDTSGRPTTIQSGTAVCFCAVGAVTRSAGGFYNEAVSKLEQALVDSDKGITAFNDRASTAHSDIMALFDRAIEIASVGAR